jgi:hypothetical protein
MQETLELGISFLGFVFDFFATASPKMYFPYGYKVFISICCTACSQCLLLHKVHSFVAFLCFRNIRRNRGFALGQMDQLDDNTFKRMFQVDHRTFDEILEPITPFLDEKNQQRLSIALAALLLIKLS